MDFTTLLKLYEDIEDDETISNDSPDMAGNDTTNDSNSPEMTDNVQDDLDDLATTLSRLIYDDPSEFRELMSDFITNNFSGESFHTKEEFLEAFADKLNSSDVIGTTVVYTVPEITEVVLDKELMNFFVDVLNDIIDENDIDFGHAIDNKEIALLIDSIFTKMEEVIPYEGNGEEE
jgi:hypothetical protein